MASIGPSVANATPYWAITQLTSDGYDHDAPQISGDLVVWRRSFDGAHYQIFTQKLGVDVSPVQLTYDADDGFMCLPQVSGDRVVWAGFDGAHYQILTQKVEPGGSPVQLTSSLNGAVSPEVSGDRVVWWDGFEKGYSDWHSFTQKVGTDASPVPLGDVANHGIDPQVSGDRVVWDDSDIYTQKIGTDASPAQLTNDVYSQGDSQVSGERVVWQGFDGTNHQVFTQKIGTDASPVRLTWQPNDGYSCDPQVSGDRVVWWGYDGAHGQIFTQKIGTDASPVRLTGDARDHNGQQVSGDRVVWAGSDGSHMQIFAQEIGVDAYPVQLTSDAHDHGTPQVSGDRIVWEGFDGAHWQIYAASLADDTTPPTTTAAGWDGNWHSAAVTLNFSATDSSGGSGMTGGFAKTEYKIDSGGWTTGTSCTVSGDGSHTVNYRSTDAAGNTETAKPATVKIDATAPTTTASGLDDRWHNGAVIIGLVGNDALSGPAGTSYSLDGGAAVPYSGSLAISTAGIHTLSYFSTDGAGNVETAKTATVKIDTGKPTSTATKNVTVKKGRKATFSFKVSDPAPSCGAASVTITIKLKAKTAKTITVPNAATNKAGSCFFKVTLKKGSYTWTVKATDIAGNVGKASVARRLTVK